MGLINSILPWALAFILVAISLFVIVLYIRGAFRWRSLLHVDNAISPTDPRFPLVVKSLTESLSTKGQIIGFWQTVQSIQQARIDAINNAQFSIQFETFMMTPGRRAQDFAAAVSRIKCQLHVALPSFW